MFLAKTDNWYMERIIWLLAGVFTIASVGLGVFVHPYWFILTGIVGLNQIVLSLAGSKRWWIFRLKKPRSKEFS